MYAPVSNGELLDKYSILLIKKENIKKQEKIEKVNNEIKCLINYVNKLKDEFDIDNLFDALLNVNKKLWNIEDNIRIKKNKNLMKNLFNWRSVYFTNDETKIKNEINNNTNSNIFEVKFMKNTINYSNTF